MTNPGPRGKSKLVATWLALIGGVFGLQWFYLHGPSDARGWLCIPPTLLGVYGVMRAREIGMDDHVSWVLMPVLGVMLVIATLSAIVHGLTPDAKWNARFNPTRPMPDAGWLTVLGVLLALALGSVALMTTVAFSAQRYFEYQAEQAPGSRS